ncbi:peptide chain release factor N(5)-glutamine methyltransferase [Danxiaibacter flavus]|uniref:peptide chain release factor N(5)-glutamine methyltransferase n=1 Tax=Danxiaibacter flavus TaxID=3049108 RepID=A0ABV3Z9W4_9BACT|nr:peptide chain release factor N(5)-glutamine methyltransferase [Chitinophagaceae bacterium DXS]
MTVQNAYLQQVTTLSTVYEQREAATIAGWVMENVTGMRRVDRLIHKDRLLTAAELDQLNSYTQRLLQHEPVQYVLNEAWFAGMKFYVDNNVLIPRPETEELVEWILQYVAATHGPETRVSIIDIGTGSGCIPVSLKNELPFSTVYAVDVSEGALTVARKNADSLNTAIVFLQQDILEVDLWQNIPEADIIVSNPPYIKESEAEQMHKNVLQHEPHLALFVPNEDALIFYRKIADMALQRLKPQGALFFEINEALGREVCEMLTQKGFTKVELRKDLQQKDRMVTALLPLRN